MNADQLRLVRERFGIDAAAIVKRVKPDRHIVASAFADWSKPDLPARYITAYKPVLDSLARGVAPDAGRRSGRHRFQGGRQAHAGLDARSG